MLAVQGALESHALDAVLELANARPDTPPVKLELLFAGSSGADAAAEPREQRSLAGQAWQQVIKL